MKIALCLETSQAARSGLVYSLLQKYAEAYGHTVFNYGADGEGSSYQPTYTQVGLLNSILLGSKAVDFVVTGCATGMGAMIASNAFPGVQCGFIVDPTDAVLVKDINGVNAVSVPLQKGFGLAGELNLGWMLKMLFDPDAPSYLDDASKCACRGMKSELDYAKSVSHPKLLDMLRVYDEASLKYVIGSDYFKNNFYDNCADAEIAEFLKGLSE